MADHEKNVEGFPDRLHRLERRDFIKGVGLTSAAVGLTGFGAAAIRAELLNYPPLCDNHNQESWVKQVDNPTTGIDWEVMERYNPYADTVVPQNLLRFMNQEEISSLTNAGQRLAKERIKNHTPGQTLRDQALYHTFRESTNVIPRQFTSPIQTDTPEQRGVSTWKGSPEDAASMIRQAARHMGAADVAFVHLDKKTRKLIYRIDSDGKPIQLENVEKGYETSEKRVIPYSAEWVIVYSVAMSADTLKRAPTAIGAQTSYLSYNRGYLIQMWLQGFLNALGYQGLGEARLNGLGISPAFGVIGGLGELSRQNRLISPIHGPMVRVFKLITDLPLAVDRPIDAGISQFCRTCKKCAEACPPGALSFAEDPTWTPVGIWNSIGHEAWYEDSLKCLRYWLSDTCTNCGICVSVCPWSKKDFGIHNHMAKMAIAKSPILNGTLRSIDDALGYGEQKDPDSWWNEKFQEYGLYY